MVIKTIWDNTKLGGDSFVLSDGKKCFKMYNSELYTIDGLNFYQNCQNALQGYTVTYLEGFDIGVGKKIKTIRVDFLFLSLEKYIATDIKTKEQKIVSEVVYQEGKMLSEIIGYNDYNLGYIYNILPLLEHIQANIVKQLGVDMSTSDKLGNNIPMQFQINPNNIKVLEVDREKQAMHLVVTDIAMMIDGFIQKNKERLKGIL